MKHLKSIELFEWDIPGDPTGDPSMMVQNLRIPDTISIKKYSDEWIKKPCRKCKKKIKRGK